MAEIKKEQTMRFSDAELGQIKSSFADDDSYLFLIRRVFIQDSLTDGEITKLRSFLKEPTLKLVRKAFLPELEGNAPLFQLTSLKVALAIELKGLPLEQAWPLIQAKNLEEKYLDQQMGFLEGSTEGALFSFSEMGKIEGKTPEQAFIDITAWNFLLSHIDTQIRQLKFLAGFKTETVEETKNRLSQNSNK